MTTLKLRNTRRGTRLPITYSDLGDAVHGDSVELERKGFKGIELTVISTWAADGATHARHLEDANFFLVHGNDQALRKINIKAKPPCNVGIGTDYIDYVFGERREELSFAVSVWARGPTGPRFMVNAFVFKDLGSTFRGLDKRLYLWMVCGRFPKAFKLGLDHAKREARAHKYRGLCLTASRLQLIPTYRRYGFDVTPNACLPRRSRTTTREYRDRVNHFMCTDEVDCSQLDRWSDNLLAFAAGKTTPTFPPGTNAEEKKAISEAFYDNAATRITGDPEVSFPPGDGIFMDLCLGAV